MEIYIRTMGSAIVTDETVANEMGSLPRRNGEEENRKLIIGNRETGSVDFREV
jgi:hypothetical protein